MDSTVLGSTIIHSVNHAIYEYNPSLKLAMDIAKVFDVAVEEIFSFEEDVEE